MMRLPSYDRAAEWLKTKQEDTTFRPWRSPPCPCVLEGHALGSAAKQARTEPTGTGEWRVTLDVVVRKVAVDDVGAETEVPMDDWVEIGVFAPADEGEEVGEPLHLEKHWFRSGGQSITLTMPRKPGRAGIDPYHLLLDRDVEDNAPEIEVTGR